MDTITTAKSIDYIASFSDGDDRTISFTNPRADITPAQIKALADKIRDKNLLIGDKNGAPFVNFKAVNIVQKSNTKLDIS